MRCERSLESTFCACECLSETDQMANSLPRMRLWDSSAALVAPWQLDEAQPPAPM